MAWRDYSQNNYGYDAYDEKSLGHNAMPMTATSHSSHMGTGSHHLHHAPTNGHHPANGTHNLSHISQNHGPPPPAVSLPRPQHYHHSAGNGRQRGDNGASNPATNPDFYFMPSQRKYSGEVVRVYVDHNKR